MRYSIPVTAAALLLASACSSSSTPTAAPTGPTAAPVPTRTLAPCPAPVDSRFSWPAKVPSDLPKPPSSTYLSTTTSADGVTVVRLSSAISLQQSVLFVIKEVQAAGYTLGRGDAEPAEADAPFGKGDLRGIYKMVTRDNCATDWLIAVAKLKVGGGSPVLPHASRGPSSSPLPFG